MISKFLKTKQLTRSLLNKSFLPVTESFVKVINEYRDNNDYGKKVENARTFDTHNQKTTYL